MVSRCCAVPCDWCEGSVGSFDWSILSIIRWLLRSRRHCAIVRASSIRTDCRCAPVYDANPCKTTTPSGPKSHFWYSSSKESLP
eukprot:scaffold54313_cov63-Phaeocystis_antarctica.AAC.2